MFGKRSDAEPAPPQPAAPPPAAPAAAPPAHPAAGEPAPDLPPMAPPAAAPAMPAAPAPEPAEAEKPKSKLSTERRSNEYYDIKTTIFNALIDAIDLTQLAQLDRDSARDEIRDIVNEIIAIKDVMMSISEQEDLLEDICNDVLGYGPLEPLLARDDIADIMVNGCRDDLHRSRRQGAGHQCPVPRQQPAAEHLPAYCVAGRPAGRRSQPDLRRAPSRRQPCQRDRRAALHRRRRPSPFVSSRKTSLRWTS